MKYLIQTFLALILLVPAFAQPITPGEYGNGLKIAFDSSSKKFSGYFENYTGFDEASGRPRFSCIFYIEGTVKTPAFGVATYDPNDKTNDLLNGTIEIVNDKKIKIKLPEEHGGCWNVQHFADEPVQFSLEHKQNWIQIKYVNVAKTNFYSGKAENKILKAYLVNGDFVCIEKIEQQWAYCTYFGEKAFKGWLKLAALNTL